MGKRGGFSSGFGRSIDAGGSRRVQLRKRRMVSGAMGASVDSRDTDRIARCLKGYETAFADLYATHAGRVKAYLLRSGFAPAEADDLTQETFVRAFRSLRRYDAARGSFRAWLGEIAGGVAWKHRRRILRDRPFNPPPVEAIFFEGGPPLAEEPCELPPAPTTRKPPRLELRRALVYAACVAVGACIAIGAMRLMRDCSPAGREPLNFDTALVKVPETAPAPPIQKPPQREPAPTPSLATLRNQLQAVRQERDRARRQRDEALAKVQTLRERQAARTAEMQSRLRAEQDRVERLQTALDRLGKQVESLQTQRSADAEKIMVLREELAAVHHRKTARYDRVLGAYLSALAPGQEGLQALQTAARAGRLLKRCTKLRQQAKAESQTRTLDRVEVFLLRLEMLDTDDVSAMVAFENQVRTSGLARDVDAVLTSKHAGKPMRSFLAEVSLVLVGVERVG